MDQPVAYLRGEWGSGPHHFKFDSRDLTKNPMKFLKQGVFPHLRKFEGSARILDTPLLLLECYRNWFLSAVPKNVG